MAVALDIGLVVLLLGVATWATLARDALVAVIAFVVYGLLLALLWVRLAAIDVALTEAAIGSGLTGILLLNAAARLRSSPEIVARVDTPTRLLAAVLCAMIAAGLALIVVFFPPDPAPTLAPAVMASLPESNIGNPVAGVLFVYRALDTLLEKVVLLLALLGVWSLAPDRAWSGVPELRLYHQPSAVLTFLAQVLPPVGIVAGVYMCWVGASDPGGAFQGGAILAAMWLLVVIAGLRVFPRVTEQRMRVLLVAGPIVFLTIGLAGFVLADAFLAYPKGYAKPLIVLIEFTLTLSIAVTLGLLAAGPPARAQHP